MIEKFGIMRCVSKINSLKGYDGVDYEFNKKNMVGVY